MGVLHNAVGPSQYDKIHAVTIFDDFVAYLTGGLWTSVAATSGTTAQDDTAGADNLLLTTAATDNDQQGFRSTKAVFLPVDGQALWCEFLFQASDFSTTSAALYMGFWSAAPQSSTSATVPAASYTGAIIYYLEGDTTFRVQTSNGAAKTNYTSTALRNSGQWQRARIDIVKRDGSNVQVTFAINGATLMDANYPNQPIIAVIPIAAMVKMFVAATVQAGSANAQTAAFDYAVASKARLTI